FSHNNIEGCGKDPLKILGNSSLPGTDTLHYSNNFVIDHNFINTTKGSKNDGGHMINVQNFGQNVIIHDNIMVGAKVNGSIGTEAGVRVYSNYEAGRKSGSRVK